MVLAVEGTWILRDNLLAPWFVGQLLQATRDLDPAVEPMRLARSSILGQNARAPSIQIIPIWGLKYVNRIHFGLFGAPGEVCLCGLTHGGTFLFGSDFWDSFVQ